MEPTTLRSQLKEIYLQHRANLPKYAWENEADRWCELVFCLLHRVNGEESELARNAVNILRELNLLDIEKLASIEPESDHAIAFRVVLKRYEFSDESIKLSLNLLSQIAGAIEEGYGGKIQKLLRIQCERMADDIFGVFQKFESNASGNQSIDDDILRYTLIHWLQNTLNMPISLNNPSIKRFCESNNIQIGDLLAVADDLNLNISLLDDLMDIAEVAKQEEFDTQTKQMANEGAK